MANSSSLASSHPHSDTERAAHWFNQAQEHLQQRNTLAHARLILCGLGQNHSARRVLCLLTGMPRFLPEHAVYLAGLSSKQTPRLLEALRACGAILPNTASFDTDEDETACARIEKFVEDLALEVHEMSSPSDQIAAVELFWRGRYGEMVNPAVAALLRQEMES